MNRSFFGPPVPETMCEIDFSFWPIFTQLRSGNISYKPFFEVENGGNDQKDEFWCLCLSHNCVKMSPKVKNKHVVRSARDGGPEKIIKKYDINYGIFLYFNLL